MTTAPVPEDIPDDLRQTLERIRRLVDSILGPPGTRQDVLQAGLSDEVSVEVVRGVSATVPPETAEAVAQVGDLRITIEEIDRAERTLRDYSRKAGLATSDATRWILAAQAVLKAGRWLAEHSPF